MRPEIVHTVAESLPAIDGYVYPNEAKLLWSVLIVASGRDALGVPLS